MVVSTGAPKSSLVYECLPEVLGTAEESLSLVKHTLAASVPMIHGDPFPSLSMIGIGLGAGLGSWEVQKGVENYRRAPDSESAERAKARIFSGSLVASGALVSLIGKIPGLSIAPICSLAADALFGIGALFAMGMSGLGIYRCSRFLTRLNKAEDGLQFLFNTALVTEEDRKALQGTVSKEVLTQKLDEKYEAKGNYFRRRSSSRAFELLIDWRGDPSKLIETVRWETRKKIALFAIALVASAVALTALGFGVFCGAGPVSFILYAVCSSIYLSLGAYSLFGKREAQSLDFRDKRALSF